jgi:hypothetical protein
MDWAWWSDFLALMFSLSDPTTFLFVGMREGKVYATEVWDCDNVINCFEVAAADVIPGQL